MACINNHRHALFSRCVIPAGSGGPHRQRWISARLGVRQVAMTDQSSTRRGRSPDPQSDRRVSGHTSICLSTLANASTPRIHRLFVGKLPRRRSYLITNSSRWASPLSCMACTTGAASSARCGSIPVLGAGGEFPLFAAAFVSAGDSALRRALTVLRGAGSKWR